MDASFYMKEKYHKYIAPGQMTVHRYSDYTEPFVDILLTDDVLNEEGVKLLNTVRKRFVETPPGVVVRGELAVQRTGMMEYDGVTAWCTWNNLNLTGKVIKSDNPKLPVGENISTSVAVLYDEFACHGWVYTTSGSLYAFEQRPEN